MPNRILKESICVSDTIDELTWFEEVCFYRLIVNCDDYGRFDGRAAVLKNRLFPLKESVTLRAVSDAINKLASVGLVALYEYDGRPYLRIPTWARHQNVRAKRSKYPEPPDVENPVHKPVENSRDNTCMQMQSDAGYCARNPIQSESYSKSISKTESESDSSARARAAGSVCAGYDSAEFERLRRQRITELRRL